MKRIMQALRDLFRLAMNPPPHPAAVELERHAVRAEKQSQKIDREADEFAAMIDGMRSQGGRSKKKSRAGRK